MYKDLPCINCPVLAICINKDIIQCPIVSTFLQDYYKSSAYPHWPQMLRTLRETLRGEWTTVWINSKIVAIKRYHVSL